MRAEKTCSICPKGAWSGEEADGEARQPCRRRMNVRITNPKAMIILGRDRRQDGTTALGPGQQLDLEVIKR